MFLAVMSGLIYSYLNIDEAILSMAIAIMFLYGLFDAWDNLD